MKRRTALALVTIAAAAATLAAQSGLEQKIRRIENGLLPPVVLKGRPIRTTKLEDRMRELKIPAVSVAVFDKGRIEWLRAWGMADVAAGRRAKPDTRFQAASISKPVAAAAALALVSRGRLSLDGDINAHLTTWKLPDNEFTAKQKVTLKHLLTHSGGVTVSGFRGYAKNEEVPTLLQLLDGVKPANSGPVRVDIPVGSRWRYAGGGYEIVQLAIEDETKKPFAQTARELVLQPFGMARSTFVQPIPADLREHAATGYRAGGEAIPGNWHTYPEQAAAGLWTTPEDLARFALELQKIASGKSQKVMSREIAEQMLQRHVDEYGLGVAVMGDGRETRFGHGGSNVGFRCYLVAYRDLASGVAIMTNSDLGGVILQDVVRAVAREYGWPGMNPIERTLGAADPSTYRDFAGRYELPTRSPPAVIQIVVDGDRLFRGTGPARSELMPENANTFFATDSDFRIEFVRDGSGKVTEAKVSQGGTEGRAVRSAGL
jgi:CubicO group peptidase (beta-lactamase class C family)